MSRICSFVLLLLLCACGGGGGGATSDPNLTDVSPYASASPYANILKDCALATSENSFCSMAQLPLIGHDSPTPSVADVMARLLVSHPWMGERFEQVLNQLPADTLTLFKGVASIVIDSDIRPSHYSYATATIYLDPANLWLTNAEKATVAQGHDIRSDYGAELQFDYLWRYVKDNAYAYLYYSLEGTETRQLSDILYRFSRVIFHELAHANDFLPPSRQATLDRQLTPSAAFLATENQTIAAQLEAAAPLASPVMKDLAGGLFFGDPTIQRHKEYSAAAVGAEFATDAASGAYSYANRYEDVAMLFEETLMKYHFDVDRDIAFTDRPTDSSPACDAYLVRWGVRGRLGDPQVRARAQLVIETLMPDSDLSVFFAGLAEPTPMTNNLGWCTNLALGDTAGRGFTARGLATEKGIRPDQVKGDRLSPEY